LSEVNYFLYIVGTTSEIGSFQIGDCGVGRTSIGVGILDAPHGTMYVIPSEYMHRMAKTKNPGPETIKFHSLRYYDLE